MHYGSHFADPWGIAGWVNLCNFAGSGSQQTQNTKPGRGPHKPHKCLCFSLSTIHRTTQEQHHCTEFCLLKKNITLETRTSAHWALSTPSACVLMWYKTAEMFKGITPQISFFLKINFDMTCGFGSSDFSETEVLGLTLKQTPEVPTHIWLWINQVWGTGMKTWPSQAENNQDWEQRGRSGVAWGSQCGPHKPLLPECLMISVGIQPHIMSLSEVIDRIKELQSQISKNFCSSWSQKQNCASCQSKSPIYLFYLFDAWAVRVDFSHAHSRNVLYWIHIYVGFCFARINWKIHHTTCFVQYIGFIDPMCFQKPRSKLYCPFSSKPVHFQQLSGLDHPTEK